MHFSMTDGWEPGWGIFFAFLPYIVLFYLLLFILIFVPLKLFRGTREAKKIDYTAPAQASVKNKSIKKNYLTLSLFLFTLGILYFIDLGSERTVFGISYSFHMPTIFNPRDEWGSLKLGAALLVLSWLCLLRQSDK